MKKRKTVSNNVIKFTGATLLTFSLTTGGITLFDYLFDHNEKICPFVPLVGYQHQINQINSDNDNKDNGITARYQAEINQNVYTIPVKRILDDGTIIYDEIIVSEDGYVPESIVIEKKNNYNDRYEDAEVVKVLTLKKKHN